MNDLISRGKLFNLLAPVQTLGEAYGIIQGMETVDAVPVVRCRDCLYWQKGSLFRGHTVCRYVLDCSVVRREDDFCSRGERKDGERHGADIR